ncbi:hypothetical protein Tco_0027000 [Tanacetum coccineum]
MLRGYPLLRFFCNEHIALILSFLLILFSPLSRPRRVYRPRNLGEPSSLFDFEEVLSIPHNNIGPPPARPPPPNNNGPPPVVRPNGQAPRSMEELCQPSIDGRGRPIAPIPIQATDFGLRHHMIQVSKITYQFHQHDYRETMPLDILINVLEITRLNIEVKMGFRRRAHLLCLFSYSLTHHATHCMICLPGIPFHIFSIYDEEISLEIFSSFHGD